MKDPNDLNLEDLDDLTKQIIKAAENWPNWKKELYNNQYAISKHSEKLELNPNEGEIPIATPPDVCCNICSKQSVCKFIEQYKKSSEIIEKFCKQSDIRISPIIVNISCAQYSLDRQIRTPEGIPWYNR